MDNYKANIEYIADFIASGETPEEEFKIGIEAEHFIVDKTSMETIDHFDEAGTSFVLREMREFYDEPVYTDGIFFGLRRKNASISVEPAGQLEISLDPLRDIDSVRSEYEKFLKEMDAVLSPHNMKIFAGGYHPVSKINDIKTISKKRYKYMSEYLSQRGSLALNMMKGTSSVQASIDYSDQNDFIKKFRLANLLSCIIYFLTDNVTVFEGEPAGRLTRMNIWQNTDPDRCGIAQGALDRQFGYREYAEYVYNRPPIIHMENGELVFSAGRKASEIYSEKKINREETEYLLSMFFPDVRAKTYLEIRSADSMNADCLSAYASFIKGIFYGKSIDRLLGLFSSAGSAEEADARMQLQLRWNKAQVYGRNIIDLCTGLLDCACEELNEEKNYIMPLYEMLERKSEQRTILQ